MKFTLSWLKEFLDTEASVEALAERLTDIGLEVEQITDRSAELASFVVASIISTEQHPKADKLRVCQVYTGTETLQIVCGAPNARAGIKIVLAPVGSKMPGNGMLIKAAQIRDVASNGMICSAAELAVDFECAAGGIIELAADAVVGELFIKLTGLDDPFFSVSITPNRGDCLGVYGIARDLAASGIGSLKPITYQEITSSFESPIKVTIEDNHACPLFVGRYFKNVTNCESPTWLKKRLLTINETPISALIDITNYIMYSFGRPMHVFEANAITQELVVAFSKPGETITALNDKTYTLTGEEIVVKDQANTLAIAGIIGGMESGVSLDTKQIFLEAALFDPILIAKTGRKLAIDTDARYRNERGLDADFVIAGTKLASQLIFEICGGEVSELVIAGNEHYQPRYITFDYDLVKTLGGVELGHEAISRIITSLGFKIQKNSIEVPSWRNDVSIPEDLVEEVVRIHGYSNLVSVLLPRINELPDVALNKKQRNSNVMRRVLASRGLNEVITWSFMSLKKCQNFGEEHADLILLNPISVDLDSLRPSIIPNLLSCLQKNQARGFKDLSFFEIGPVFSGGSPGEQQLAVSGIRSGLNLRKNIYHTARPFDVYDVKADFEEILSSSGLTIDKVSITTGAKSYYHPGRSATCKLGQKILGYFGEIHPRIVESYDLKTAMGFELIMDNLPNTSMRQQSQFIASDYQAIERDYAFIIDRNYPAGDLIKLIKAVDKELITDCYLFDIYMGSNIETNKQSIALAVIIQAPNRTLTGNEIEALHLKIIVAVESMTGGKLRQ